MVRKKKDGLVIPKHQTTYLKLQLIEQAHCAFTYSYYIKDRLLRFSNDLKSGIGVSYFPQISLNHFMLLVSFDTP